MARRIEDAGVRLVGAALLAPLLLTACVPGGDDCVDGSEASPVAVPVGVLAAGEAVPAAVEINPEVRVSPDESALSPGGGRLAAGCPAGLCLWDTATGDLVEEQDGVGGAFAWTDGAAGEVMVTTGHDSGEEQGEVILRDPDGGRETCTMLGHDIPFATDVSQSPGTLAVSPDGRLAATGAADGTVGIWSIEERRNLGFLDVDHDYPSDVAWSPDSARIAVGGQDAPIEVWDVEEQDRVAVADDEPRTALAWSPDGAAIAAGTAEEDDDAQPRLVLLDADSLTPSEAVDAARVTDLAWSPDGSRLAWTTTGTTVLLAEADPAAAGLGSPVELTGHQDPPTRALFTADGEALLTLDPVAGVRRWTMPDGEPSTRFERPAPRPG